MLILLILSLLTSCFKCYRIKFNLSRNKNHILILSLDLKHISYLDTLFKSRFENLLSMPAWWSRYFHQSFQICKHLSVFKLEPHPNPKVVFK